MNVYERSQPRLIEDWVIDLTVSESRKYFYELLVDKCKKFVSGRDDKGQYDYLVRERGVEKERAMEDDQIGKLSEGFCGFGCIERFGFPYLPPDFKVLEPHEKNWNPDLPYGLKFQQGLPNIHVKCCSDHTLRSCRQQYTWTFNFGNRSGRGGKDSLLHNLNSSDLVAFMYMANIYSKQATVKAILPWCCVSTYLGEPQHKKLFGYKKAIYLKDLQDHRDNILSFCTGLFGAATWTPPPPTPSFSQKYAMRLPSSTANVSITTFT